VPKKLGIIIVGYIKRRKRERDSREFRMNILCKLKLHKWQYRAKTSYPFLIQDVTRYCERCEKIERASWIPNPILSPKFK